MLFKKKIFLGLTNIASQLNDFQRGFEDFGYQTYSVVMADYNIITESNADYNIENSIIKKFKNSQSIISKSKIKIYRQYLIYNLFKKAIKECDIFFFMWNSFFVDCRDIKLLKKNNKKIIVFFVGDDIRGINAMKQEFSEYKMKPIELSEETDLSFKRKIGYLRNAEKYSDLILSSKNQSQLSLRPYNIAKVPINLNNFKENIFQRKIPLIIHSPSLRSGKGTKYILSVIELLKSHNIHFDFQLIENIPYNEVKNYYTNADILIEQLLCPGGGKQSREALACGTVVVSNMDPIYNDVVDINCPIIHANVETLYDVLKDLILDHTKRIEIANMGRKWVEEFHSHKIVSKNIIDSLYNPSSPEIFPTFFRDKYLPVSLKEKKILNKWTQYVKDCGWYKENVKPGERAGLEF